MNAIADQSKFDEESASRPHLDAELKRQRAEVYILSREVKKAWSEAHKLKADNTSISVILEKIEDARFGRELEHALEAAEERRDYLRQIGLL